MLQIPHDLLAPLLSEEDLRQLTQLGPQELADCLVDGFLNGRPRGTLPSQSRALRPPSDVPSTPAEPPRAPPLGPACSANPASHSSHSLGLQGERDVERILASHFTVERTAEQTAAGDLLVLHQGHRVMVEVKNYAFPVPTAEVEKLERDMSVHGEVGGGLLVSLRSPITGHEAVCLRATADGRPLAFLRSSHPDIIRTVVRLVLLEAERQRRRAGQHALEAHGYARIYASIEQIGDLLAQQGGLRLQIAQLKKTVDRQCDLLAEALLQIEVRVQERVDTLLDLLLLHQHPAETEEVPRRSLRTHLQQLVLALAPKTEEAPSRQHFCHKEPGQSALLALVRAVRNRARRQALKKVGCSGTTRYAQADVGGVLFRFQPLCTKLLLHILLPAESTVTIPLYLKYEPYVITADVSRAFIPQHLDALCAWIEVAAFVSPP